MRYTVRLDPPDAPENDEHDPNCPLCEGWGTYEDADEDGKRLIRCNCTPVALEVAE